MERDIHIGRVGIEALADHQACLAMRRGAVSRETDLSREGKITAGLFPHVVKCVAIEPHVLAAPGDRIASGARVEGCRAGMEHRSNVLMMLE